MSNTTIEFLAAFVILIIIFLIIHYIVSFVYYIGKKIRNRRLGIR